MVSCEANEKNLPIFEALASSVRLKIISMLKDKPMNIKEIAVQLGLSSAITTMHIKKLERAGIISTEIAQSSRGRQKLCSLAVTKIEVLMPEKQCYHKKFIELNLPIGHYTDFNITPTCGLATTKKIIGNFDDPRAFLDPERVNCGILWFNSGFIEYTIPNNLEVNQTMIELNISFEIASEYPRTNNNWPSEITFSINDVEVGTYISPGDFGDVLGRYNPQWWCPALNQYGLLKVLSITDKGTFIDGNKVSDVTISDLNIKGKSYKLRFAVKEDSDYVGGLSLFGKGFGNYNQDIVIRTYYK